MNLSNYWVVIVILLLGGMLSCASAQEPANFQGNWDMEETGGLSFGLELFQDGATLSGYHCGMTSNASRIDCSLASDGDVSITGSITGNVVKVRFTSAYSGEVGMARLTLRDGALVWEITAFPNGDYYLPEQATLTKTDEASDTAKTSETAAAPDAADIDDPRLRQLLTLVNQDLSAQNYAYPVHLDENYRACADLNTDGIEDVVAIFYAFDESIDTPNSDVRTEDRFLAIGFGAPDGNVALALNVQAVACLDCGGVYGEPEIRLTAEAGVITLSSYGGSNWRWENIQKIRYEDDAFKVIGYSENSYHTGSGVTFGYDGNLNTLEAIRDYDYNEGAGGAGTVRFHHLIANRAAAPLIIDGALNEADWRSAQSTHIRQVAEVVYKPENWSGAADLNFTASTVWDDDGFYLGLIVEDDRVVPVENLDAILKGDHLELWLDLAESVVRWDDEGWPRRQKPDGQIIQIGAGVPVSGSAAVARVLYPEHPAETFNIQAAAAFTPTGYTLEIAIPRAQFEALAPAHDEWQWQDGLLFGLSVVVSDTDNPQNRRQDCLMSTSAVQWGNPYTFGVGSLVEIYAKPDFPIGSWPVRY